MRASYPFLFLGAGKASFYEHYAMKVKFVRTPSVSEAELIMRIVPCALYIDPFDFKGSLTMAWNDSYVQQGIQQCYGRRADVRPQHLHELYWCSDNAILAFEKAIIRWLMRVHAFVPIELVYRPVDPVSDGIVFSDWHDWSVREVVSVVEKWSVDPSAIREANEQSFRDLLLGIANYAQLSEETARRIVERYGPERLH